MIQRGGIHWADLGEPRGSAPAKRRPVLVVQSESFNRSRIGTVIVMVLTSNVQLSNVPGNTFLPAVDTGLPKDSVANASQLYTLNRFDLLERAGSVPADLMQKVDGGIRQVLGL